MFAFPPFPGPARETPTAKSCTLDASSALDPGTRTSQSRAVLLVLGGFSLLSKGGAAFSLRKGRWFLCKISVIIKEQSYYLSVLLSRTRDLRSKIPTIGRLNDIMLLLQFYSAIQFCFLIQ